MIYRYSLAWEMGNGLFFDSKEQLFLIIPFSHFSIAWANDFCREELPRSLVTVVSDFHYGLDFLPVISSLFRWIRNSTKGEWLCFLYRTIKFLFRSLILLLPMHIAVGMRGLVKFTLCKGAGWIKWVLCRNEIVVRSPGLCCGDCWCSLAQGCNLTPVSLRPLCLWPRFSVWCFLFLPLFTC